MKKFTSAKVYAVLNLLGLLATVTVNALANILPINGFNTGQVSDLYPNLFAPAGLTFGIWGVIYLLLFAFVLYGLVGVFRKNEKTASKINQIGIWFVLGCVANCGWIFAWHYLLLPVTLGLMFVLLASLSVIYRQVRRQPAPDSSNEYIFLQLPFGVYLGWISIASMANVTAFLVHIGWDRFGLSEDFWLTLMLFIAIVLTLFMALRNRDAEYTAVVIWALIGICIKRNQTGTTDLVGFYVALTGIAILVFSLFYVLYYRLSRFRK